MCPLRANGGHLQMKKSVTNALANRFDFPSRQDGQSLGAATASKTRSS
jgi:hypothetical protein